MTATTAAATTALMQSNGGSLRRLNQHPHPNQSLQQRSTPNPPSLFYNSRLINRPPGGNIRPSLSDNGESSLPGFVRSSWATDLRSARELTTSERAQSVSTTGSAAAIDKEQSAGDGRPGGTMTSSSPLTIAPYGTTRSPTSAITAAGSRTSTPSTGGGVAVGDGTGPLEVTIDTSKARSTVDVVRMCIRELGWREVNY